MIEENESKVPCPNCGGVVEVTTSRDARVLSSYAQCNGCEGQYFLIESNVYSQIGFGSVAYDLILSRYEEWAVTDDAKLGYRAGGEWC